MADGQNTPIYGDDDLYSPRAIREYLEQVRRVNRRAAVELEDDKAAIFQLIANSKGIPILFGLDTRRAARRVTEPFGEMIEAHLAISRLAALAWHRFRTQFRDTLAAAGPNDGRPRGRQMEWDDQ